jgi:hypothetical protein
MLVPSYLLMEDDNELTPSYGRTILKNLDGTIIVRPEAPESVEIGNSIWFLSDIGKQRWNEGKSINYYACFSGGMDKRVLELDIF